VRLAIARAHARQPHARILDHRSPRARLPRTPTCAIEGDFAADIAAPVIAFARAELVDDESRSSHAPTWAIW
jgi:hypothetical protein